MNRKNKITMLSAGLLALFLVGCSSTPDETATAEETTTIDGYTPAEVTATGYETTVGVEETADSALDSAEDDWQPQEPEALTWTIFYPFDQSALDAEKRLLLDAHVAVLSRTNAKVRLEGYADERGTREYNLALGERRARSVADYFALRGISRSRIEVVSYGEEKPLAFGHTEADYAKNRRVKILY